MYISNLFWFLRVKHDILSYLSQDRFCPGFIFSVICYILLKGDDLFLFLKTFCTCCIMYILVYKAHLLLGQINPPGVKPAYKMD